MPKSNNKKAHGKRGAAVATGNGREPEKADAQSKDMQPATPAGTSSSVASTAHSNSARARMHRRRHSASSVDSTGGSAAAREDDCTGHVSTGELPRIPANVVRKLVAFSVLLLIAPILVYFFSLKYVFVGSTAPSAIAAVIAANMVLAGYVYAAWVEDSESNSQEKPKDS